MNGGGCSILIVACGVGDGPLSHIQCTRIECHRASDGVGILARHGPLIAEICSIQVLERI